MKPPSILFEIRDAVDKEQDLDCAKKILLDFLNTKNQTSDIKKMKVQIQYQCFSRDKLTKWLYNNIMAYQDMGVIGAYK